MFSSGKSTKSTTRSAKAIFLGMLLVFLFGMSVQAHAQCSAPANAIVAENCLTGNPSSEWDIGGGENGDLSIQGFATDISVNQGSTISFKINTPASAYTINIYRIGYYGGKGARKVASIVPSAHLPQTQPACMTDGTKGSTSTGLWDCGNWAISASWQVPATATSGIYVAHLIRTDTGGDSHIVFIVRNDASHSSIMYQTSDETWQAYNYYGGGSLYSQATPVWDLTDRAYKVSYNRPVLTRGFNQEWDTWVFGAEFAMVQWLEQNGYDVTYFTGVDAARSGSLILNHKVYMDSGHDEYWSAQQRTNVQAARDAGVNLAFFSGNTMFWKTRWENSIDGSNSTYRTLACYKETLAFAKIDTQNPTIWTGTFRDPSFSPPADGGNPENSLTGLLFMVNGTGPDNDGSQQVKVPAADGKMRFWRNTAVANQAPGATYATPAGTLGYEWDVDTDNGSRPAGQFQLSTSTYQLTDDYLLDFGATYGAGTGTHHMVMYRAPSGALVFNSGTIDWSWGLNSNHDSFFDFANPNPDPNMQQATVNLLADMGVQPGTLQSGLVSAVASTDRVPPSSMITFPTSGTQLNTGNTVTVTGIASDSGGNVAGVEFSPDGGTTWHPAVGRGTWSYSWTPSVTGAQTTIMSRAVDDSGNLETVTNGVQVSVASQTCPCSIWGSSRGPTTADSGDGAAVEVGVKFRPDSDGSILGVRFYKSAKNTGSHIGHLWTDSGTLLGTVNFTGESATGWQQANFSTPVSVSANTTYVVSYYTPVGHYSADAYYFLQSGVDNPPLHALANGVDGADGMFFYPPTGTLGGFPASGSLSSNYWVDVSYTSSNTFNISGSISGPGGASATVSLSGAETSSTTADASGNYNFAGAINGTYTVTPSQAGVSFTPPNLSVTVSGSSLNGVNFTAAVTNPLSISGTITNGAGATITLGGGASATATADASGNYSFTGLLDGTYSVIPAASGLIFTPSAQNIRLSGSSATNVNFQAKVCNCISIFPSSATPSLIDSNDTPPVEVGVRFTVDSVGAVVGVKFYKASTNLGTHIGHLWTSTGTLLGSVTFTNETASGWQQASFSTPIQLIPNTTYVVSYYAPSGHYSADTNYFASAGVNNPPLHALQDGANGNGVYLYTSNQTGGFPANTYSASNYWVDVVYASNAVPLGSLGGTITGGAGATVSLTGSSSATTTADSSGNYIFNSVAPGSYSITPNLTTEAFSPGNQNVTMNGTNITGVNFSVAQLCPCTTIWTSTTVPGTTDSGDALSYELGVKFRADTDGYILGVRFYKAAANTGTHVAHLWSPVNSSKPLTSAAFSNEGASGWQQVLFATPVPVSANATYIASYFDPVGHYSTNPGFFSAGGVDSPPLHALADGVDGQNGVFSQSSTSQLPTSAFNGSNYWVDVIYATTATHSIGGIITGTGAAGATVTLGGAASAATTADSFGNYRFNSLADGVYAVTPSSTGITFSPGSQSVTISGAHNLEVNFTSGVPAFAVSGTVTGGPGITVSLTGTSSGTATADASGDYTFPAVPNGTYTVTPSGSGFTVTPTSQNITVSGANVGSINFTATSLSYAISGTISGGGGAIISLAGATSLTTTAGTAGSYSFPGITNGTYTLTPAETGLVFMPTSLTVAVSGANITGANFTVPANCPCDTIWQPTATPAVIDVSDNTSVELGVKFRSDTDGYITGIRFYKSTANTGVHQGNLWTSTSTLLANVTFTNEGASGWQQAFFSAPVAITANTTYIASYFAPAGNYSASSGNFATAGVDAPPLHALADGVDGPDGIYVYSATSTFPSNSAGGANYWVDVIYSATAVQTFSITGTISGPGGNGATVSLSGASTAMTTANASGAYTFSGLANKSYVVTPANSGFTFTPANQPITLNGANATANFSSIAQTFTITGTISGTGGNGATVSLIGTSTATVTANASGGYTFSGLANGSYTVTPMRSGFSFTPPSLPATVNGANATANFTSAQNFTISGTISGAGGNGATVQLTGASSKTATASTTGAYSFSVPNGVYTVTPTKSGFVFTQPSQSVTVSGANKTANFTSAAQTFTLSGTISGAGGSGATVKLTGSATATVTANTSGVYTISGVPNGSYTVTPTKTGFTYTPPNQAVTVSGANATANFSSVQTFTLSGTISGAGGSGAIVKLTGSATATVIANTFGVYTFSGVPNGSYTVTPTKTGFTYTPPSQAVNVNGANKTANFSSVAQTFTISGTITGTGGSGATVKLTGTSTATVTANSSGVYSFTGVKVGSYTVTPTKTGFTYTPSSRPVTINGANATANFTSARRSGS